MHSEDTSEAEVRFRPYLSSDFGRLVELTEEAWPDEVTIADWRCMRKTYAQLALEKSTWKELACESDRIVGLLFGRIKWRDDGILPRTSIAISRLKLILKTLIENRGKISRPDTVILAHLLTDAKLSIASPESDAEVVYLIVSSENRGQGIGSMLMERFSAAAAKAGATKLSAYTDDQASDWRFYEKKGFEKKRTFYDNWSSHFNGKPSNGVIFVQQLK